MRPESALIQLQAWAQEESAAQAAQLDALDLLARAVEKGGASELQAASDALEAAVATSDGRARRRSELTGVLGRAWGVPGETLSLTSILERAESAGLAEAGGLGALRCLRDELRSQALELVRRAQLLNTVAGYHRSVLSELVALLDGTAAGSSGGATATPTLSGNHVDAEA